MLGDSRLNNYWAVFVRAALFLRQVIFYSQSIISDFELYSRVYKEGLGANLFIAWFGGINSSQYS